VQRDLVHRGFVLGCLEQGGEVGDGEVGDADGAREAVVPDLLELLPGGLEVVLDELGGVDEVEVDLIELELRSG
jgi:hypothetical protein